ncbi:putative sodium-dependent multivitamin transporter [Trichonephila inaurata madagascariensis]|uniref:Putative sodium-dependent multivitamin transporter n=1 Tax=Trichonephila inaurata madagascariensis TaxID=2747483 RepID=A0A8X7BW95_9ARAC|nr:putative sodium-dependent multivitamin transporter [Trichonephila inaurata madagascariensis]
MLYMAIILYAPALALNVVTGLSKWSSVYLIGFVCTFYSTLGGMRAVLWTDLFQSLIMLSAAFAVCIKGTMDVGGLSEVWRIAEEGQRIQFFEFDPDPTVRHTFWTLVVGGFFTYFTVNTNQVQIQRLLTVKSLKEAVFCYLFIQTVLVILLCFAGIVIYANLSACDPILRSEETNIHKADQGVMIGYISSICFSLTIGTMGMAKVQKPPSYHLSTDACPGNNYSLFLNYSTPGYLDQVTYENWNISSQTFTQKYEEEYVFPLLKLSYMWFAGVGFFTCFVVGLFASAICGKKEHVNSALLSPVTRFWISEKDHIPEIIQLTQSS